MAGIDAVRPADTPKPPPQPQPDKPTQQSWGDRQDASRKAAIADARGDQPRQTPADRQEIKSAARGLLDARDAGLVKFGDDTTKANTRIDGGTARYLQSLTGAPDGRDLPMRPELARVIDRMLAAAQERREHGATGVDFTIVSLDRPNKGHKDGISVDIGRYAGHPVDFKNPEDSVQGVTKFYEDLLGKGHGGTTPVDAKIAMGLPRNPKTDPVGALADYNDRGHPEKREYYDAKPTQKGVNDVISQDPYTVSTIRPELKEKFTFPDTFFGREKVPDRSPTGRLMSDIAALGQNARQAFEPLARQDTGNMLRFLFPDALDHFHVQIQPK